MSANDGSGKAVVAFGDPSHELHDGSRWMLTIQAVPGGGAYDIDNVTAQKEVFAVRSDGSQSIQLTNGGLDVEPYDTGLDSNPTQWALDGEVADGKISYTARLWDNGVLITSAIVTVPVFFDPTTEVPIEAPQTPDIVVVHPSTTPPLWHDWSPDGAEVVFEEGAELYITNTVANSTTLLLGDDSRPGGAPSWASDGSLIVFHSPDGIETITPSGANRRLVIADWANRKHSTSYRYPHWSPDSQFIVYRSHEWNSNRGSTIDVYRADRNGNNATNLTTDIDLAPGPMAWR